MTGLVALGLLLCQALTLLATVVHIGPYDRPLLDYLQSLSGDPSIRTDIWQVSRDEGVIVHVESYERLAEAIENFRREGDAPDKVFELRVLQTKKELREAILRERRAVEAATKRLLEQTGVRGGGFADLLWPVAFDPFEDYKSSPSETLRESQKEEEDAGIPLLYDKRWFRTYHPYGVIRKWFKGLETQFPGYVEFIPSISKSYKTYEGREIFAVRLTQKDGENSLKHSDPAKQKRKKQIYVQSLIHAREWISGAVAQYLTLHLLQDHQALLSEVEFLIVPIVNPDGYEYTWSHERLWRKNRKPNHDGDDWLGRSSVGVDINRNFDIEWHHGGSSSSGRAEDYAGPHAGSENETKALMEFFEENDRIVGVLCLHSFSELILRPWGWASSSDPINRIDECYHKAVGAAGVSTLDGLFRPTSSSRSIRPVHRGRAPHEHQLSRFASNIASRILSSHGQSYVSELAGDLYMTTGAAQDWFYSVTRHDKETGLKWRAAAYTIELRPRPDDNWWNPGQGFILDPKHILPTAEEIWTAFVPYVRDVTQDILYC